MTKLRNELAEVFFANFLNINIVTTTSLIYCDLVLGTSFTFLTELSDKNPICLLQVYRTVSKCIVKPQSKHRTEVNSVAICLFSLIKSLHMHSHKSELIIQNKPHSKIKKKLLESLGFLFKAKQD